MTTDQAVALIGAITTLTIAITTLVVTLNRIYVQIKKNHQIVEEAMNGFTLAREMAAKKTGELEGRDYVLRQTQQQPNAEWPTNAGESTEPR